MLLALAGWLNSGGEYRCVYANFEVGQAARVDTARAMRALIGEVGSRSRLALQDDFVDRAKTELLEEFGPDAALKSSSVGQGPVHSHAKDLSQRSRLPGM